MEILNKTATNELSKPEIEQVQKDKQEYKLIGSYIRTKGLTLYSYNSSKNEIKVVDVSHKDTINLIPTSDGIRLEESGTEEAQIDTRNIQFEALNLRNAEKRINKWKNGKIKELCNLRIPSKEGINLFK